MTISVSVKARYEQIYFKVPIANIKIYAEHIYSTIQYSTVQHNAVRTEQNSTVQCSTVQYSTMECVQYSAYSTVQHNTVRTVQYIPLCVKARPLLSKENRT